MRLRREHFTDLLDWTNSTDTLLKSWWRSGGPYRIGSGLIYEYADAPNNHERPYVPLTDPDLFLSFARLGARGEPSNFSIINWVSKYGLLRLKPGSGRPQDSMRVEEFREEVRRARGLLTFYEELKTRDAAAIRARIAGPESPTDERLASLFGSERYTVFKTMYRRRSLGEDYPNLSPKEIEEKYGSFFVESNIDEDTADLLLGWAALAEILTDLVAGVHMTVGIAGAPSAALGSEVSVFPEGDLRFDPKLVQSWRCQDLRDAIYMQFYLMAVDSKPMRICENPACRTPFQVTRKDKRVCNDSCRSNARHYRQP